MKKIIIKLKESERQLVECWTRVMGYFRPVSSYNPAKKSEFAERKWFDETKGQKHIHEDAPKSK